MDQHAEHSTHHSADVVAHTFRVQQSLSAGELIPEVLASYVDLGTPVTSIYWTFILEYTSDSKGSYRTHHHIGLI